MTVDSNIPRHVAIIMDGNGRWAQKRGKERIEGHIAGVESVRRAIKAAAARGVEVLTLYVFSTENWGRPQTEVDALMDLLCRCVEQEADELVRQGARVRIVGDRTTMPAEICERLAGLEAKTADGQQITVLLALNYSARAEIAGAVRAIARQMAQGQITEEEVTPEMVSANLYTAGYPDPDLVIRTGGDIRLSNFMLWQAAYSELYFEPSYWPDFDAAALDRAIEAYGQRERRYGLISKQQQPEQDEK